MKAIILAAWEWSRLRPLSNTTPKPLIPIFGKPIIEHNLEHIFHLVDEIIFVVKYKKELIESYFWSSYKWVKVTYHTQWDDKGTGAAIKDLSLKDPTDILLLNGDSIFEKSDLEKLAHLQWYGALVKEVEDPSKYGVFSQNSDGTAQKIIEKPERWVGNLANVGVYKFQSDIINISKNIPLSPRGEYEITDSINEFLTRYPFHLLPLTGNFIDVGYPWDILDANTYFLEKLETSDIKGIIEEWVTIKGNIILEEWAILKSGTYIEGNIYIWKNTSIWPHTYLRGNSVIGENCHIGNAVEIKNSSLGNHTNVAHLSYIWDSVIGNHVNIGWGCIAANLRHDGANIKAMSKGELTDTKRRKLWVIIGDFVKTWANTTIYPGRTLENNTFTQIWEIVK